MSIRPRPSRARIDAPARMSICFSSAPRRVLKGASYRPMAIVSGWCRALRCLASARRGSCGRGVAQARHLLRAHGTKLVIGMGGYASAGVLLAAWSLGLQTVIHEANIVPGLTNRLFGRLADRMYLGF